MAQGDTLAIPFNDHTGGGGQLSYLWWISRRTGGLVIGGCIFIVVSIIPLYDYEVTCLQTHTSIMKSSVVMGKTCPAMSGPGQWHGFQLGGGGGEVLDLHFIMCVGGVKEKLSKAHSVCVVCVCCVCVCVCLGGGVRCNRVYLLMGVDFM